MTETPAAFERVSGALSRAYRLERALGRGGMATVYLADDLKHHRPVAIKVLHPELAAALGHERFLREVEIAARLQHPHILPLFDSGEADGLLYYTMPYVEGESLRARLARDHKLPIADVTRIMREMADALAEAHARGVVHRDIKPDNVLLSGGHAVVADFGIAKAVAAATETGAPPNDTLTATGVAIGSPPYMAPEQAVGDVTTDHRADLYALGVVAYEALAGERPFAGLSSQAVFAAHLTETPPPLATRRPDVPPALASLVARLLARRPEDRVQSAAEVLRLLDTEATPAAGATADGRVSRRSVIRPAALGLIAALALLGGALGVLRARRPASAGTTPAAASPAAPRYVERRVAVAPFENQTGDSALAALGRLTSDWITQGLTEAGFAEVVDRETIRFSWETAPDLRALAAVTGARFVVSGTYYLEGDSVRLLARIMDAGAGKLVRVVGPVSAPVARPRQALASLREAVLGVVATVLDARGSAWAMTSTLPPSLAAYQRWAAGLEHNYRGEFQEAVTDFMAAARLDTTWVLPVLMAGAANSNRGDFVTADSLYQVVDRRRDRLAPADRYFFELKRAELRGDNASALRAGREMLRVAPASSVALILLSFPAMHLNRPREAIAALTRLDSDRPPITQYPRYWGVLTSAQHLLGDYQEELAAAVHGRRQHPENLHALYNEARALAALGRIADVQRLLEEVEGLSANSGSVPSDVMRDIGAELRAHGHEAAAGHAFAQALAWLDDRVAEERATIPARGRRAAVLYNLGRWVEARTVVERLLSERPGEVDFRGYAGALAARRGDLAAALAADRALAAMRDPYLHGRHTYWRARIAALLGERERSLALIRDAIQQGRDYLEVHGEADFAALRDMPSFRNLMQPQG